MATGLEFSEMPMEWITISDKAKDYFRERDWWAIGLRFNPEDALLSHGSLVEHARFELFSELALRRLASDPNFPRITLTQDDENKTFINALGVGYSIGIDRNTSDDIEKPTNGVLVLGGLEETDSQTYVLARTMYIQELNRILYSARMSLVPYYLPEPQLRRATLITSGLRGTENFGLDIVKRSVGN